MTSLLTKPVITIIVAMAENRVIGQNNQLPWHLPIDLQHFKQLTTGHAIIMGRKTYASIGKPLPNRTNLILTHDTHFTAPGCLVAHTLEEALTHPAINLSKEVFIIGGAEIYELALPYTEYIHMTIIHQTIEGDALFPILNMDEWGKTGEKTHKADNVNAYDCSFLQWKRIIIAHHRTPSTLLAK